LQAWNCETEYNLNKIQLELNNNDSVVYRNFGVNTGWGDACDSDGMESIMFYWTEGELVIPSNLEYSGDPALRTTANVLKWNSTEMACAYRSFDSGNSVRLICAYNARGDVVGQQIYQEGNGTCPQGTQCGDNGTCVYDLCRVPTTKPGLMYLFATEASYDCSLEETATDSAKKCESSFTRINKYSMDGGINRAVIKETNISKEGALELSELDETFAKVKNAGQEGKSMDMETAYQRIKKGPSERVLDSGGDPMMTIFCEQGYEAEE
uniref:C-type lectin domain-containing protein n=1 Tax=Nippostrongylus brasiliensis TaxID=27835 RepID=A0A0N4Y658_NIPBR